LEAAIGPIDTARARPSEGQEAHGEIEKTTERGVKTRQDLFNKLVEELTIHEKIEEQIFYPAVKERATSKELEELVTESYEEHHFVDVVKAEIEETPFDAEEWAAKFKVRKIFSKAELEDLGARMEELKSELMDVVPTEERAGA
jgi:hypothetical protein